MTGRRGLTKVWKIETPTSRASYTSIPACIAGPCFGARVSRSARSLQVFSIARDVCTRGRSMSRSAPNPSWKIVIGIRQMIFLRVEADLAL